MTDIFVAKRLIDYAGLLARGIPEATLPIIAKIQPTLSLIQGMTADGAKLVSVDANGNLQIAAGAGGLNVGQFGGVAVGGLGYPGDGNWGANGTPSWLAVAASVQMWNGANNTALRSASATDLAAQSGLGVALVAPPGQWTVVSTPGAGVQASAVKAAGGAGVRHICTGITYSAAAAVAPVATVMSVSIRDGASGAGTILMTFLVFMNAAIGEEVPPITFPGLGLVGSANTAMTAEWNALLANVQQTVTLVGYDAS